MPLQIAATLRDIRQCVTATVPGASATLERCEKASPPPDSVRAATEQGENLATSLESLRFDTAIWGIMLKE